MCEQNEKYMKVIESIGELLIQKDRAIKVSEYEIKALKKKIERIEQYINFYQSKEEIVETNFIEESI